MALGAGSSSDRFEGYDRTDLRLPGRQDELVWAVAAVNPRTVVVVDAGAPVEMPWRHDVAAIVLSWFGGQEFGDALADVLLGRVEPGGRLPTTWPDRLGDVPVSAAVPVDGQVHYAEGIHIGYRAWMRSGAEPAYPFGHGLGYSAWQLGPAVIGDRSADGAYRVEVSVTNLGNRSSGGVVGPRARRAGAESRLVVIDCSFGPGMVIYHCRRLQLRVQRRYLPAAAAAATALGSMVSAGRRERGWTATELAERLGISAQTLRRLERGSPTVAVGLVFEAALLCGVELFSTPSDQLDRLARDAQHRVALIPANPRTTPVSIDDDF